MQSKNIIGIHNDQLRFINNARVIVAFLKSKKQPINFP